MLFLLTLYVKILITNSVQLLQMREELIQNINVTEKQQSDEAKNILRFCLLAKNSYL